MGVEMDSRSIYLFYFSILIICVINFITLIKYFVKKSNLEKYFNGNYSQFIFLPLILFTILNFFGYPKRKDEDMEKFIKIPYVRLSFSLVICIIGLIILCGLYFLSFIKKNEEEANEENPNYSLKIFYEVLLIFYLYYFFHLIQLLRIKGKIKDIDEFRNLFKKERQIPFKFQIVMASIIEIVFGLIGLVIIFFGKAFTYAFYQIFIYVAFLIIRADNEKINIEDNEVKIKLNVYDYIISSIMIALTFFCVIFLICLVRKKYYLKYF
jgi:MFS family permease